MRVCVLGVLLILFIPSLALAQPCPPVNVVMAEGQQEWWMVLLEFIVQLSVPIVTMVLGVLGTWLIRKLTKKWDAEHQEAALRLTDGLLTAGIAFAEEQARKAVRAGETRTRGADKLGHAIDFIHNQIDQSGLPNIAEAELKKLIEAKLQQERSKPDGVVPSDPT